MEGVARARNLLNLPAFDYTSSDQITEEVRKQVSEAPRSPLKASAHAAIEAGARGAAAESDVPIYQVDASCVVPALAEHARGREAAEGRASSMIPEFAATVLSFLPEWMQAVVWYGVVAVILFISVILMMAFLTLAERRVIGSIGAHRAQPRRALGLCSRSPTC